MLQGRWARVACHRFGVTAARLCWEFVRDRNMEGAGVGAEVGSVKPRDEGMGQRRAVNA